MLLGSELRKLPNDNPKELVPNQELVFGYTFTDNMLMCFEGIKAYKDKQGYQRVDRMYQRARSYRHQVDPVGTRLSMYIRPTVIRTSEFIGVGPNDRAILFVICCSVGSYYKSGFKAVSLQATTDRARAWPGGTGDSKIGANYAPGILPQISAVKEGYHQNLWLCGENDQFVEMGTMNCFVFPKNEQGDTELVPPPPNGSILPGVTRDSILGLAREFKVSDREITMSEIVKAQEEGRLIEMLGIACVPLDPNSQADPVTRRLNDTSLTIQHGEIEHPCTEKGRHSC
ncbi:D-aminoacid aminotransferase-like PLP-dependent enzyme [Basidiobolus meristosporus CBS 931.73]|uniref:D-aminoacid aminotransferase-like PLP-dependent enzyme n=1 Tax=Basidiobolus meristosporus CBS 931.73 TaxID=1314790 RepID=A0A1Y1Z0Q8_9FUNG|nr:D-aminoacid aminotransferase-like PLP-dependent enzyme [Basidiobolus meristosporus CBS 931.73]|eukprot:ORY03878.1 D-aminoacid aminotransferase-like PLP-dependent enzyme [Basidiobolus meristosporus CBS 931.73]